MKESLTSNKPLVGRIKKRDASPKTRRLYPVYRHRLATIRRRRRPQHKRAAKIGTIGRRKTSSNNVRIDLLIGFGSLTRTIERIKTIRQQVCHHCYDVR
jgi:hypothetical protein